MGILLFLRMLGTLFKPKNYHIYTKEGMLIVALCWVLWSFFGGLPFVFAGQIPSVIDAFFEMSSGFTTSGLLFLQILESHPSLLFWRSFAHLIGGMGVLVFALAIMNNSKMVTMRLCVQRCLVQYLVKSLPSSKYSSDSLHHLSDYVCYFCCYSLALRYANL